jgi:hypothetical protein
VPIPRWPARLLIISAALVASVHSAAAAPVLLAAWNESPFAVLHNTNDPGAAATIAFDIELGPGFCSPQNTLLGCSFRLAQGVTGIFDFGRSASPNFDRLVSQLTDDVDAYFGFGVAVFNSNGTLNSGYGGGKETDYFSSLLTGRSISSFG